MKEYIHLSNKCFSHYVHDTPIEQCLVEISERQKILAQSGEKCYFDLIILQREIFSNASRNRFVNPDERWKKYEPLVEWVEDRVFEITRGWPVAEQPDLQSTDGQNPHQFLHKLRQQLKDVNSLLGRYSTEARLKRLSDAEWSELKRFDILLHEIWLIYDDQDSGCRIS